MDQKNLEIYVVGPNRLQNELIAFFISEVTKFNCIVYDTINTIPVNSNCLQQQYLILLDCSGKPCNMRVISNLRNSFPRNYFALFNLPINSGSELNALQNGVSGILYENDDISMLSKMVQAIIGNEIWISRRVDPESLNSKIGYAPLLMEKEFGLTNREREILSYLSLGYSNCKIAEVTYTSTHTVKTHIYKIFKKIKVTNRLQAARWAAENF